MMYVCMCRCLSVCLLVFNVCFQERLFGYRKTATYITLLTNVSFLLAVEHSTHAREGGRLNENGFGQVSFTSTPK